MRNAIPFACSLDCYDACRLVAEVEDGRVTKIRGDRDHPLTRGRVCTKGKLHLKRLYHPERLRRPLRRTGNGWEAISWDQAVAMIAEHFDQACRQWDSRAILYYADSGYGGVLKSVDHMFFNHLGGVSVPRGSLCWAAGIAAQRYDFGDVRGHAPQDIARARTVLLWGRNPLETSPHLLPFLEEVRARGGEIVVVDPLRTATAAWADRHIPIRPGTDGALALAMCRHLVESDLIDRDNVARHTIGFRRFRASLAAFDLQAAAAATGITPGTITALAENYARNRPASIVMGYGLQRYVNGGQTVRCIDALAALSGQIGISGGGANYANRSIRRRMHPDVLDSERRAVRRRTFALPRMARFLERAQDPPVTTLMIAKANPCVQMPDIDRLQAAFARVPFKVVVDLFMTDTARTADLVLPGTHILEEEDLVYSSMFSPWLNYSPRVVAPPPGVIGEYELFQRLARQMGLDDFPRLSPTAFLQRSVSPLLESRGLSWEAFRQAPVRIPEDDVPWADGRFATPSGKYEFYSARAAADGHAALPVYLPPADPKPAFPLRLLSTHFRHSLHSQHFMDRRDRPRAHLHPDEARRHGIATDQPVRLESPRGTLDATSAITSRVPPGIVQVYQGWWRHSGAVNSLTHDAMSTMGANAAYFETFCRIVPLPADPPSGKETR